MFSGCCLETPFYIVEERIFGKKESGMEEQIMRLSVRNLVEFVLREGDIDNRTTGSMEKDAMQQGSRIHRKIQRRMGADYRAEVSMKERFPCCGFILQLEGRADGIFKENDRTYIDEIKAVYRELNFIEEPVGIHLAQAKCYAYMYAFQNNLKVISVQMTYCNIETEEIKYFREEYQLDELSAWIFGVVRQYEKWARFQLEWRAQRNQTIRNTEFPFLYRKGQRELVSSVYRSILRRKKLFIQAPTGVGKTMATIFPAVRAIGEGHGDILFYLTAKTITRTVAEQAFQTLRAKGLQYKVITLTAKEKICFCEETQCNPDACPYAKGHYDRVNDAVFDLITNAHELTREVLEEQAKKYRVCPFEMALDVSVWVDAVICDYNYVFDPNAHLKRFFSEGGEKNYLFLIDEAHNLVERGREMYSAQLYKEDVLSVRRLVKLEDVKLTRRLDECNKQLLELKKECENYKILESVSHIALKLMNVIGELERYLEEHQQSEKREEILNFYFQVRAFLNIYEILDDNYIIYSEMEADGRFKIKLLCVNPAVNLQSYLEQGNSTIFFSATLLPIQYYKKLLSVESDDYAVYAESSFPIENRLLLLGSDVSTKYTMRSRDMYERFAEYILQTVHGKKGNYMAFFPSYRFMEEVYEQFQIRKSEDIDSMMQSQYMNEEEREIFLEMFEETRDCSLVGFCVMGGIFSEGIDLTADRLIGALIVGTGIPQVCNDREIIKGYFDARNMSGFDYAYFYPGMNKVLQSAGRVIRTEEDQGIILLLDQRFQTRRYQEIFPREWVGIKSCSLNNVQSQIEDFWKGIEK